jgi:hypothetical protein
MGITKKLATWYEKNIGLPIYTRIYLPLIYGPWNKFIHSRWGLRMPFALPMCFSTEKKDPSEYYWEDWCRDTKKERPVRYFLLYTVPHKIRSNRIVWLYSDIRHWISAKLIYKYHLLDLRDKANEYEWGWIEHDTAIVFSIFKCTERFIFEQFSYGKNVITGKETEKEYIDKVNRILDYYMEDESWLKAYGEIFDVYYYWLFKRNDLINSIWDRPRTAHSQTSKEIRDTEDSYIHRLLKVRNVMWA